MRTFAAADGVLHGPESEWAIDAYAFGGDFDFVFFVVGGVVVVVFVVGRVCFFAPFASLGVGVVRGGYGCLRFWAGGSAVAVAGAGEPGRGVGHGWGIFLRVASVVKDFFEPDVVVVGGVSGRGGGSVSDFFLLRIRWSFSKR